VVVGKRPSLPKLEWSLVHTHCSGEGWYRSGISPTWNFLGKMNWVFLLIVYVLLFFLWMGC